MEHLKHFGLAREPFVNDPVLDFYFTSPAHDRAEKRILRALTQGKGLCTVVGGVGVGKTTLSRHILDTLDDEAFESCILVAMPIAVREGWLLTRLAAQLGVEDPSEDRATLLGQIYQALIAIREEGRRAVLFVDEAQFLADPNIIAEMRSLLNLEYEDQRAMSIVLFGQPELDDALALDEALAQRVDHRICLDSLDEASAIKYLVHRIQAAEGTSTLIEPDAMKAIYRYAEGIPRVMNSLADNALFEAHMADLLKVTLECVERAAKEMGVAKKKLKTAEPAPHLASHPASDATASPVPHLAPNVASLDESPSDVPSALDEDREMFGSDEAGASESSAEEDAIALENPIFGDGDSPPPGFIQIDPDPELVAEVTAEEEINDLFDNIEKV